MTRPLWLVVSGLGVSQIIGWGTTYYALGALSPDIARATGWSSMLIFGAFSAALLLSSLIARASGQLVDRLGGRTAMALGSLLAAIGCVILGRAETPVTYVLGWLVLAPAMRLATYDAAFAALAQVARERTRISISYLSLFGGLAGTVFWPLGHWLAASHGWQATFLIYAALNIFICLPIHILLLSGPSPHPSGEPGDGPELLAGRDRLVAMAVFAVVLALNGFVFAAISAHVIPLFADLGVAASQAVVLATIIGPSQVASRIAEIVLGRRWSSAVLGLIAFGLLPLSIALGAIGQFSFAALAIFAAVYGMSNGLVTIAKGAYPLALFGRGHYGRTLGTITAPSLVLNALAPLVMAYVLGNWSAGAAMMLCLAAATVSAAGMGWLAWRFRSA